MKEIDVCEKYRIYYWKDGSEIIIKDVIKVFISDSGSHSVTNVANETTYIPRGWFYFKFKGEVVA